MNTKELILKPRLQKPKNAPEIPEPKWSIQNGDFTIEVEKNGNTPKTTPSTINTKILKISTAVI